MKFELLRGSQKFICPDCGKKSFVPYVWSDTGEVIAENLGRCDHEQSCKHFDTWADVLQYLKGGTVTATHKAVERKEKPLYLYPLALVEEYKKATPGDNLTRFLCRTFGEVATFEALNYYGCGSTGAREFFLSDVQPGKTAIEQNFIFKKYTFKKHIAFPYIDYFGRCRGVKVMEYEPNGHRKYWTDREGAKHPCVSWLHSYDTAKYKTMIDRQKTDFKECYFGEYLTRQTEKYKFVGIVESEKTALIGRICCPDVLFIAVGGISKLSFDKLADLGLQGAKVIFYPDAPKEAENSKKNNDWCESLSKWHGGGLAKNWRVSKVAADNLRPGEDIGDILTAIDRHKFIELLNNELNTIF